MLRQPDFAGASHGIIRFRIPTPTFGLGLIEAIPDATIEGSRPCRFDSRSRRCQTAFHVTSLSTAAKENLVSFLRSL